LASIFAVSSADDSTALINSPQDTLESNVAAALAACQTLNATLAPIKQQLGPGATWPQIISAAYNASLNLSATSTFLFTANNPATNQFTYYVWAAACSVVELDVLTGEVEIISTDIVYDGGNSLNPAVDIGQIEGAFVMGVGFFFTEECITNQDKGYIINNGTWDYKPPTTLDIPQALNVTLLAGSPNPDPQAIQSSKASAEPPYMLAASAFFALKDAIATARVQAGVTADWSFDAPATVEKVQRACLVSYQQMTLSS